MNNVRKRIYFFIKSVHILSKKKASCGTYLLAAPGRPAALSRAGRFKIDDGRKFFFSLRCGLALALALVSAILRAEIVIVILISNHRYHGRQTRSR